MLFSSGEVPRLLSAYGYAGVGGLVALESLGLPVPGETALLAAAIIAGTTGALDIWLVIAVAAGGAIVGDNCGFWIGEWFGYRLLVRYGRYVRLTVRRIKLGQYLFLRYGGAIVFFGRFVALLRSLAAFLAGANRMRWPPFLAYNAAGAIAWATIYGLAAFYLGKEADRLARPVGIGLGIAAVAAAIAVGWFLHRHAAELENRAEAALPGPLRPLHRRNPE